MHEKMKSSYDVACYAADLAAEFRMAVNEYLDSGSFARADYWDSNARENVIAWRRVHPMPKVFSNKAADVANNLRSALDQAAYAVSIAAGGAGKKTYFPIAKTLSDVQAAAKGNSSEIPIEIFNYMLSYSPYQDGDFFLWALPQICNRYKHKEILRAQAVVRQSVKLSIKIVESGPDDKIAFPLPRWDEDKAELVVCRYRGPVPDFNAELLSMVSFDFEGLEHFPADGVLLDISRKVKSIVEGVNREAMRLGIFA